MMFLLPSPLSPGDLIFLSLSLSLSLSVTHTLCLPVCLYCDIAGVVLTGIVLTSVVLTAQLDVAAYLRCSLRGARPGRSGVFCLVCPFYRLAGLQITDCRSPDALRSWISRCASIPAQRQILMTARGKNVKIQSLATEVSLPAYMAITTGS